MSGWAFAGVAFAVSVVTTISLNIRERRRQRALALTRPPLDVAGFCERLVDQGIGHDLAAFLWSELRPYYVAPLTPYPTDRIYGDMKIDADDISDIAVRFEKQFGAWLGEAPLVCPPDPTIAELGEVLQCAR